LGDSRKACTDAEFDSLFETNGATKTARILGITERAVYLRRASRERAGAVIRAPSDLRTIYPGQVNLDISDGEILVGSDFHIWPGPRSTCQRAFLKLVDDIKPAAIVINGDLLDFPALSRFPRDWETITDPNEEIEAAQDYTSDLERRGKQSKKYWPIGNHDERFERAFANMTPAMRKVKGVHLHDHFPNWHKAMSLMVNQGVAGGAAQIKHIPQKGGVNSGRSSTLHAGITTVNSHLHCQHVRSYSDLNHFDRYGVDVGMVADKDHRAFSYVGGNSVDWRSGFALLTYRAGRLMYPELITKWDADHVQFRGALIKV
jgi:hypothetical protein